jgi:hypothetical protein
MKSFRVVPVLRAAVFGIAVLALGGAASAPRTANCLEAGDDWNDPAVWYIAQSIGLAPSCEDAVFANSGPNNYIGIGLQSDKWGVAGDGLVPNDHQYVYYMVMEQYGSGDPDWAWSVIIDATPTDVDEEEGPMGAYTMNLFAYHRGIRLIGMAGSCPDSISSIYECAEWSFANYPTYAHAEPTFCISNPSLAPDLCTEIQDDDPIGAGSSPSPRPSPRP